MFFASFLRLFPLCSRARSRSRARVPFTLDLTLIFVPISIFVLIALIFYNLSLAAAGFSCILRLLFFVARFLDCARVGLKRRFDSCLEV